MAISMEPSQGSYTITGGEQGKRRLNLLAEIMEPATLRLLDDTGLRAGDRFHDLRRTCVTLLLDHGAPPHVVREIVAHSDIEVTMTIHAHVSLEEKRKAPGKIGEVLG